MDELATTRRRFLAYFSGLGISSTLLPGSLWALMQEQEAVEVTSTMILQSAAVSGLELTDEQAEAMAEGVNRNLGGYATLREFGLAHEDTPPIHFNAIVPGMALDREQRPFRPSSRLCFHKFSHRFIQRNVGISEVVFPSKIGKILTFIGKKPAVAEEIG